MRKCKKKHGFAIFDPTLPSCRHRGSPGDTSVRSSGWAAAVAAIPAEGSTTSGGCVSLAARAIDPGIRSSSLGIIRFWVAGPELRLMMGPIGFRHFLDKSSGIEKYRESIQLPF